MEIMETERKIQWCLIRTAGPDGTSGNCEHGMEWCLIKTVFVQGQMELVETVNIWKQKNHIMTWFKDSWNPKPADFLSKFYEGN